ncbi:efflux RND transporter periplasmic adaptor subunit [Alteromonas oceani]|uniref:Efflux RND transporter periplasmic adaptor subunit n=1 Tax=Alteromonas oceani TaxID=2071609 RepID=A0ABV7JVX8_9ALTE|nr:efflux RND transporter periplasmic adaptor subunit [Alteromonas oceani]
MYGCIKYLFMLFACMGISFPTSAQDSPIKVTAAYPVASQKYQSITLSGAVSSANDAFLAPLQAGFVDKLFVEVGDHVQQGQPLLTLDSKLAELARQQAEAELEVGTVAYNEAERLLTEVDALSQQQLAAKTLFQQRKAEVANAKAELARLKAILALRKEVVSRHTLKAPFDGVIYQRDVDVGEWVEPTTAVLGLVSQQAKRLTIEVPQEYYSYFTNLNGDISIHPDTGLHDTITGKLERLVAASGGQGRSFTAHIALPENTDLLVGMSAEAEIMLPQLENKQVWLPTSAIRQHPDGGASVFAINNNKASRVLVNIVRQQGDAVLVANASEGQLYAISGVSRLYNEAAVTVTNRSEIND